MIPTVTLWTRNVYKNTEVFVVLLESDVRYSHAILGFDPGTVNLGLALIYEHLGYLHEVKLSRAETTQNRISQIWGILESFFMADKIIIEGPSYADRYRQVELEDVRAAVVSWSMKTNPLRECLVVPPLAIRKQVFGSAKIKNPWPEIPNNAAAALACALYGVNYEREKYEKENTIPDNLFGADPDGLATSIL